DPGVTIEFELSRTHLPIASVYRHARELPEATAMVDASTRITYREFLHRIRSAAARLAAAGVERGDRVALVAGNCAEFPVAVYATNYLGAIIVPVNFRLAAGEVAYILGDSAPSVVVTDEDRAPIVRAAVAEAEETVQVLDLVSLADPAEEADVPDPVVCASGDDQAIMYTSGTTGRPKGAVLTYSNFLTTTMRSTASWA